MEVAVFIRLVFTFVASFIVLLIIALRVQRALMHLAGRVHLRLLGGLLLLLTLKRGLLPLTLLLRGVV